MSRWGAIDSKLWVEQAFVSLSTEARLLYVWACTNTHNTPAGIYPIADRFLAIEAGVDVSSLTAVLSELERAGYMVYRDGVLWIKSYVRDYLARTGSSDKHKQGIVKALAQVPDDHELLGAWFEAYGKNPALEATLRKAFEAFPEPSYISSPSASSPPTTEAVRSNGGSEGQADWTAPAPETFCAQHMSVVPVGASCGICIDNAQLPTGSRALDQKVPF